MFKCGHVGLDVDKYGNLSLQVWEFKSGERVSCRQLFGMITGLRCLPDEKVLLRLFLYLYLYIHIFCI